MSFEGGMRRYKMCRVFPSAALHLILYVLLLAKDEESMEQAAAMRMNTEKMNGKIYLFLYAACMKFPFHIRTTHTQQITLLLVVLGDVYSLP